MSVFTHIPEKFEFEFQGGEFLAQKSFWQNTLDKSTCTYVISLSGFGEYGEVLINVNTDDWISDAIEFVKEHTVELAMQKFVDTGDESVTTNVIEAITELPAEDPDERDVPFKEYAASLPFPAVVESDPEDLPVGETEESVSDGDSQAVEDVDVSQFSTSDPLIEESPDVEVASYEEAPDGITNDEDELSFRVNTDTPNSERYGFTHSSDSGFSARPNQ